MRDPQFHKYLMSKGLEEGEATVIVKSINCTIIDLLSPLRKQLLVDLTLKSINPIHTNIVALSESSKKYKDQLHYAMVAIGFSQI